MDALPGLALRGSCDGQVARQRAEEVESRLRRGAAGVVAVAYASAVLGIAWDVQWHVVVGRDTFFAPPHWLLYSAVGLAGLVCLALTLRDTYLFRRGLPGAGEGNSVAVFGYFRGPVGFVLCGFGALALVLAAPLDELWHTLYGQDLSIWTPFHFVLAEGGLICGIGLLYAVASEANREHAKSGHAAEAPRAVTPLNVAAIVALALFLPAPLAVAMPAALQWPVATVAGLDVVTYPAMLALILPPAMIAAVCFTGRPGAASMVAFAFTAWRLVLLVAPPLLVSWMASLQEINYRPYTSNLPVLAGAFPAWSLAGGLAIDLVYARAARRMGRGAFSAAAPALAAGLAASLVVAGLDRIWYLPLSRSHDTPAILQASLLGYVLCAAVAPLGSCIGLWLGRGLRVARQ